MFGRKRKNRQSFDERINMQLEESQDLFGTLAKCLSETCRQLEI